MGIRRVENMCGGKGHVIIKDILEGDELKGLEDMTELKYKITYTSKFKLQLKKLKKQGKDLKKVKNIIEKLAKGEKLNYSYKDHKLIDNNFFHNFRECHVEPDWLLVYQINKDKLIIYFIETGSHSEILFR